MATLEGKKVSKSAKYLHLYLDGEYFRKGSLQCFFKHLQSKKEFSTKKELLEWVDRIELQFVQKKAYDYLAIRNYPSSVLKEKLLNLFLDPQKVEDVITLCIQSKYCDDQSWVDQFVQQQLQKGYGPLLIQAKLMQKKLPKNCIEKAIQSVSLEEQRHAILQKIKQLKNKKTPEEIIGFLQNRGFSLEVLYQIIKIQ